MVSYFSVDANNVYIQEVMVITQLLLNFHKGISHLVRPHNFLNDKHFLSPDMHTKEMLVFQRMLYTLHKKWSFPLRISSLNMTKSAFGHIYWRNS